MYNMSVCELSPDSMLCQHNFDVNSWYSCRLLLFCTRELKKDLYILIVINECRCDERLKSKTERSTLLSYTVFHGGMEHLKIERRLIDERFESVVGECVIVTIKVCHLKYLMLFVMKR
jgi:hypothetical protein